MQNMLSFEGDGTHPYCPKCGINLEAFSRTLEEDKLCPHVRLIYSDFAGEVVYCHDSLDARIMESGGYRFMNTSEWDSWIIEHEVESLRRQDGVVRMQEVHPVEIILKRFSEPDSFSVAVSSKGFGCGPVFETVHVIYNLND